MDSNKKSVLLVSTFAAFLTPFMSSSVNVALPTIAKEFGMNVILLSWVPTGYLLTSAVFLVPFGRVADIIGRKKVFAAGTLTFTIASLFLALSTSAIMLIALRIVQGFGAALIFGTGLAMLASVFPAGEKGRALGINAAATYFGLSLGPSLGGLLTYYLGWRTIFLINIPVGLVTILLVLKLRGEWAEAKGERFDFVGSVIFALTLVTIMYGLSELVVMSNIFLVLMGILGIVVFIRWEMKAKSAILNVSIFRHNAVFTFSNLAALISYSATYAVGFLLSLYLQYIKGISPLEAGLILIFQPIIQAFFSPLAGKLSDRNEPRKVASTAMALTFLALLFLTFLTEKTTLELVIICLLILGLGIAFFSSPNTNAIMSSVEKKYYAVASGTLGTMRQIGNMLSMAIVTMTFSVNIGMVQIIPENYPLLLTSLKVTFAIFAVLCFVGIFASLARGKMRQENLIKDFDLLELDKALCVGFVISKASKKEVRHRFT